MGSVAGVAGCGTSTAGAPEPDSGPPSLIIGSGERTFETLATDDAGATTINAYMGPQGGFHVYLSLRATGVDPGDDNDPPTACMPTADDQATNPCVAFTIQDLTAGRELDSFVPQNLPLTPSPDLPGADELDPTRLVMMSITSLADVDGHMFHLTATLDGHAGQSPIHLAADAVARCTAIQP